MDKFFTSIVDLFKNIPAAFLVAITTVLALIIFLPAEYAKTLALDTFRTEHRTILGPIFLLSVSFIAARFYIFIRSIFDKRKREEDRKKILHALTPEEKGYLIPYIIHGQNSVNAGMDDGIMTGLKAKGIVYMPGSMGSVLDGFAFNLQPWAREYLTANQHLLNGHVGQPLTPSQRMGFRY